MLSTDVTVFGDETQLRMKGAEKTIQQSFIGAKECIDDNIVTLLVLASNHNAYYMIEEELKVKFISFKLLP